MESSTLTQSARLTGHMGEPCVSEDVMGPQASLYPPWRPRGGAEDQVDLVRMHFLLWCSTHTQFYRTGFTTFPGGLGPASLDIPQTVSVR